MHLVFLIAVLAALVAMNWSYLGFDRLFGGKGGAKLFSSTRCVWRKDPRRKGENLERWVCTTCGVDAYSGTGGPPNECKRQFRDGRL